MRLFMLVLCLRMFPRTVFFFWVLQHRWCISSLWVWHLRHACLRTGPWLCFPSLSASSVPALGLAKESVIGVSELKCYIPHCFLGQPSLLYSCFLCTVTSKLRHVGVSLEICDLVIRHDRSQETGLKMKTAAKQDVIWNQVCFLVPFLIKITIFF